MNLYTYSNHWTSLRETQAFIKIMMFLKCSCIRSDSSQMFRGLSVVRYIYILGLCRLLMQLTLIKIKIKTSHNNCLLNLSTTRVTTWWLAKTTNFFCSVEGNKVFFISIYSYTHSTKTTNWKQETKLLYFHRTRATTSLSSFWQSIALTSLLVQLSQIFQLQLLEVWVFGYMVC